MLCVSPSAAGGGDTPATILKNEIKPYRNEREIVSDFLNSHDLYCSDAFICSFRNRIVQHSAGDNYNDSILDCFSRLFFRFVAIFFRNLSLNLNRLSFIAVNVFFSSFDFAVRFHSSAVSLSMRFHLFSRW